VRSGGTLSNEPSRIRSSPLNAREKRALKSLYEAAAPNGLYILPNGAGLWMSSHFLQLF